jgi:hypothetical protein
MARRYAAVLGLLGFALTLLRGIAAGGAWDSTIGQAVLMLAMFTVLGGLAGLAAERIVDDAIRSRLSTELNSRNAAASTQANATRRK